MGARERAEQRIKDLERIQQVEAGAPPQRTDIRTRARLRLDEQEQFLDKAAQGFNLGVIDRSGLQDFSTRFKVAQGDTLAEKRAAFLTDFPSGVLERVPVTGELIFKTQKDDPAEPFTTLEERGVGLQDVGEFLAETAGPIAGEIAALVLTRGASLPARAIAGGLGAAAGEVGQEQLEGARGLESGLEVGTRAGAAGTLAAGGALGGAALGPIVRGGGGESLLRVTPEAQQANQAIARLQGRGVDVDPLLTGQAAELPLIARVEEQSAALTTPVGQARRQFAEKLNTALETLTDPAGFAKGRRNIASAFDQREKELLAEAESVRRGITSGKISIEDAAATLDQGLTDFRVSSQRALSGLYKVAEDVEPATFNIAPLQELSERLSRGIQGLGREGPIQLKPVAPELAETVNNIRNLRPDLAPVEGSTPLQQLRALRENLFDLRSGEVVKNSQNPNLLSSQADQLWKELTRIMRGPTNTNPAFTARFRAAETEAAKRFDVIGKSTVRNGASTDTPTTFVRGIFQPGKFDEIRQLRNALPIERFRDLRSAALNDLLKDPNTFSQRIRDFDGPTLAQWFSNAERRQLFRAADELDKLNSIGVREAFAKHTSQKGFLDDILVRDDSAAIDQVIKLVNNAGGATSPTGRSVRAGTIDVIFDRVFLPAQQGGRKISARELNQVLKELDRNGLGRLVTKGDREFLKDLRDIAPFIRFDRGGAGASLQAAEAASGLRTLDPGAIQHLFENLGVGRALANPRLRKLLVGKKPKTPLESLQLFGALSATGTSAILSEDFIVE